MKKLSIILIFFLSFISIKAQNVAINSTGDLPDSSAGLDISFNSKGLLIPRIDISDLSIANPVSSPTKSLVVYNKNITTGPGYFYWDGNKWVKLFDTNDGKPWILSGNSGTIPGTDFLGTTDSIDLVFKTNDSEKMRITSNGNVGIGTNNPLQKLQVTDDILIGAASNGGTPDGNAEGMKIWNSHSAWFVGVDNSSDESNSQTDENFFIGHNDDSDNEGLFNIQFSGKIGIGTTTPLYRLHVLDTVSAKDNGSIYGKVVYNNDYTYGFIGYYSDDIGGSNKLIGIYGNSGSSAYGIAVAGRYSSQRYGYLGGQYFGVYGRNVPSDYNGVGGFFRGGYMGGYGIVEPSGNHYYYGLYGKVDASTNSGSGNNYGVVGVAKGGTGHNYGVYGTSDDDDGFGAYIINTNSSGTGIFAIGDNASGTYLINGSGIAATGVTSGILGLATENNGTGLIGTGNGDTSIITLSSGSGVSGNGITCGVYAYANDASGSGIIVQNGNSNGWTGNFQGNTLIGNSTSDVHNFWGAFQAGSNNNNHIIIPYNGDYGYIGTNSYYWYYMYSDNYVNISQRNLKRNICKLDSTGEQIIMQDIENMKPSLYKYKTETDEFEKGNEAKYRPNAHIGLILDEVPDYIQDNAFSGVDIYALSTVALTGVKYNRESIKNYKKKFPTLELQE